jgi:hypothetical protein
MVEIIWWNLQRINITRIQAKTTNNGQWSIISTQKLFYKKWHGISIGTPILSQAQRCWACHQNFQGTLCDRPGISRPIFPNAPFGSHSASSINNIELTAYIKAAPTTLSGSSFSWPDWLLLLSLVVHYHQSVVLDCTCDLAIITLSLYHHHYHRMYIWYNRDCVIVMLYWYWYCIVLCLTAAAL